LKNAIVFKGALQMSRFTLLYLLSQAFSRHRQQSTAIDRRWRRQWENYWKTATLYF